MELENTFLSSEYINYKNSENYLGISTLFNPFDDKIWFNILFSFLSVLVTSILIDYVESNIYSSSFHFVRRMYSSFWHYLASILNQCKYLWENGLEF